jgi:hypothetical protein
MDTEYRIHPAHNDVGSQPYHLDTKVPTWETRTLVATTKIQTSDKLASDTLDKATAHHSSQLQTATYQKIPVVWNMKLCHCVSSSQHSEQSPCLQLLGLLDSDEEGTTNFQNVGNYSSIDIPSHSRRLRSSSFDIICTNNSMQGDTKHNQQINSELGIH